MKDKLKMKAKTIIAEHGYYSNVDDRIEVTERQADVLKDVLNGQINNNIANSRGISVKTVQKHKKCLFETLGVSDAVEIFTKLCRKSKKN